MVSLMNSFWLLEKAADHSFRSQQQWEPTADKDGGHQPTHNERGYSYPANITQDYNTRFRR